MSAVKSPEELRARDVGKKEEIVVEKAEAEELLPGWRKEVKMRKTGSRTKIDRYYTDPVTGYTFRSIKDAQRYLKTGELGKLAIKPKVNSCVHMDDEDEKLNVARHQRSCLVEMKSSENFVESTTTEDGTCVPENASGPCKKIVEVNAIGSREREEKSESKEHMMGPSPVSETSRHKRPLEHGSEGYRTRSKSESPQRVSKRLAAINIDAPLPSSPEPKTRQATRLAGIKIDEPSPSPSLPDPKTRQATRTTGIKTDSPPPTPPEPKTRQATRLASISPSSPPEPKTCEAARIAGIKVDAPAPEPKTRHASRQAGIKVDALVASPPEPKTRQARRLAGMEIGASPPSLSQPKTRQATRVAGIEIDASTPSLPESKTRQATRPAGMEIDASPLSLPETKTRQATQPAGIRIDASPPSLPEPKTRQATRLAGLKMDPPPPSQPVPRTSRQATVRRTREAETRTSVDLATPKENEKIVEVEKSASHECVGEMRDKHDGDADMDMDNCKQETSILSPPASQESREKINKDDCKADEKQDFIFSTMTPSTPKEHYKEIEMGPTAVSHTTPKEQAPPPTPVNLGSHKHQEKLELGVFNPEGDIKAESSMNFCLNDLWTDPCIEFAVKTLTGAIPFGDLNKADNFAATPLEVPLEELWTDPCIEFAVKTLTGAIPVGEDQDYLQHQPSSCSANTPAVHSFSLPDVGRNFCQTEVLSKHFETANNSNNKKQEEEDGLGNGVLEKSGNIEGSSNVECSRARLF